LGIIFICLQQSKTLLSDKVKKIIWVDVELASLLP